MGIFDIFGTSDQTAAANDQIAGLNTGFNQASGYLNQGIGALNTNYASALQPFTQNYSNTNAGVTQLGNVLGLNGAAGNQSAMTALQNTPGYQFQLQQGNNAINAAAAANGTLNSGNQLTALSNYNQRLAGTTYNNYVSQLQPYLNASNSAASGIAGVNTGLGNQLAGQYGNLGQLAYSTQTGIGNANANKDLAGLNASGNILNAGMQAATAAASFFSDERLKEDIERVGSLDDGQPVYKYRYVGSPAFQIGLMAQDVEKINPDAVTEIMGFKAVNYDKATDYAAELSSFLDGADRGNVVEFAPRMTAPKSYATDLSRFLEAA